jgi:ATP-dependent Clp protease ATP-binding subunit ClpA
LMTTNLGAADPRPAGFSSDPDAPPDPGNAIKSFFRPELIGRLDAVVPFRPLDPSSLEAIVDLEIGKLRERPGVIARALRIELSSQARRRLASLGHDPKLGARPLRRTIEDLIVAPIAERISREPDFRNAVVRVVASGEVGDIVI